MRGGVKQFLAIVGPKHIVMISCVRGEDIHHAKKTALFCDPSRFTTADRLVAPLAVGSPRLRREPRSGLRLSLALEVERHCSADEILQGRLIDLVAFVDVDGAPDISFEAGVE